MLSQPLLHGTKHKREVILEQEITRANAIFSEYVTCIWKRVYASV